MYCVYQKTHQNGIENIVSNIKSSDIFVSTVKDIIENIYKIKYVVAEDGDFIVSNSKYEDGYYLLVLENNITLYLRKTTVHEGYVYNSTDVSVKPVYSWKLIPFQIPVSSEIIETVDPKQRIIVSDDEDVAVISYENSCEGCQSGSTI
jgi:hypothetical protein